MKHICSNLLTCALWAALALGLHLNALAYTVTTLADSGPGSLRDALATAPPNENITFSVTGTITLTSGELVVSAQHGIIGPGANQLTISGNNASRVINIVPGGFIVMSGVTIADGQGVGTARQ